MLDLKPEAVDAGMFHCPRCGSDAVRYQHISKRFAFLSILLLGMPLLWHTRTHTCEACGHVWR